MESERSGQRRGDTSFERRSSAMQRALELAKELAAVDDPVVLVGEPGTGRRRMAGYIHDASLRRTHALVELDASLILNGFDRRVGELFRSADRGSVLLQNVDLLPEPMLLKLVQTIQRHCAGGSRFQTTTGVRVFVVGCPTTMGLPESDTFGYELLQRGMAQAIRVPPLRERGPDIPGLVEEFLSELCDERRRGPCSFSADALDSLERYPWAENVRELKEVLRRAVITVGGGRVIDVTEIPRRIRSASEPSSTSDLTLAEVEKQHVVAVLTRLGGHREVTARALGISVSTLARRLEEYGLARRHELTIDE